MYDKDDADPEQVVVNESRSVARGKVDRFIRKSKYLSYVSAGYKPQDAARRVGINIPVTERISAYEVLKRVEEGK